MAIFKKDGFDFFDGFFSEPVFNLDNSNFVEKLIYLKKHRIKNVSLDNTLIDFSFLEEINFLEEVYISNNIIVSDFYTLKNLKRIVVNIAKDKPNLDYSNFSKLEYLSIDWYLQFPDLSNNTNLKELVIWKFKPKAKSFSELKLPKELENFEITESNVVNFEGLNLQKIKKLELSYCNALESLESLNQVNFNLEVLVLESCKKLINYDNLGNFKNLRKIILSNCGDIPNLKWLLKLKKVNHFSFWNTKLIDGDTSPCSYIDFVSFKNAKHYSHKEEEFIKH